MKQPSEIRPAAGKLGVLLPGFGAVATTFVAGVEAARRGLAKPIGSLTQMNTIRLGKRTDDRTPLIKDFVPLVDLENLVFGAWDPKAGYCGSLENIPADLRLNHRVETVGGVLEGECAEILKGFFSRLRESR